MSKHDEIRIGKATALIILDTDFSGIIAQCGNETGKYFKFR
jgi:hypothetical protein